MTGHGAARPALRARWRLPGPRGILARGRLRRIEGVKAIGYAKAALRKSWWPVRRLTAPLRRLPDALILGAQKAGTTTLFHWLAQHPEVASAARKEIHFFDTSYERGLGHYRAHFPTALLRPAFEGAGGRGRLLFDATPSYLYAPWIPGRVARDLPHAKHVVLLRDPVERAFSHWRLSRRHGREDLSFDEAILRETERTAASARRAEADGGGRVTSEYWWHSYAARGRYAEQLERWFAAFPRERFLVLESDALREDPASAFADVCRFLGLSPWRPAAFESRNVGGEKDRPSPATVERLRAHFRPHDERLAALLGKRLRWMG